MNAPTTDLLPPASRRQLLDFLRTSSSRLSPAEAMAGAIKLWIATQRSAASPVRGFQWKCLFLPATTRLRMIHESVSYYAEVVEEEIIFRGRAVSPRQMTIDIAGEGRNAWRDLWLRLPGEKHWTAATQLRARLQKQAATRPSTPVETMSAAANTMRDALNTALVLIEHVDHQTKTTMERRLPRHRRAHDELTDDH